jgi:hypothetical protein
VLSARTGASLRTAAVPVAGNADADADATSGGSGTSD